MATAVETAVEVVKAEVRTPGSTNDARRLRRAGRLPAVLYGARKQTLALSVDPRQIARILHSVAGHNTIFELEVGPERTQAMVVDWQIEPVKGMLLHVDLKRITMDARIRVRVPVKLVGEAAGVKQQGGILDWVMREVEIECLPGDIPVFIEGDVTELVFGKVLRVADLPHGGKLRFITPADQTVAHITAVKEEEVAPAAEVVAEAAPAEPEVIKKGKQEVEEEVPAETGKKEKEKA